MCSDKTEQQRNYRNTTVVGGWSVAVARALNALGCDGEGLLNAAGADISSNLKENNRFSSDNTRRLWQLAREETGLEDIGLQVARFVCPTTFHALGFSLWASSSLLDALKRMVRFEVLLNDGCHLYLENNEQHCTFTMAVDECNGVPFVVDEGVDYFLGAVVKMFRDMTSESYAPVEVHLSRPLPDHAELWSEFFQCPVQFATKSNRLIFATEGLTANLATGNRLLAEQNDKLVENYLSQMKAQNLSDQVRSALIDLMPLGITTLDGVADALAMTPRTLQYKLAQQDMTLQELRDTLREELARKYLQYSLQPFTQIAYSLGFSDPAHFNRAFKRWTGETPTVFRRRTSSL